MLLKTDTSYPRALDAQGMDISQLTVLGPAIGASIAAVYAIRTANVTARVTVKASFSKERLTIALEFLDALQACRNASNLNAIARARHQLSTARLRVSVAFFNSETVQSAADEASRCARHLVDGWSHLPDGEDERVLKTLRNMADEDREMGRSASDAQSALDFIAEISQAQQTAHDNNAPEPDFRELEGDLHCLKRATGVAVNAAIVPCQLRTDRGYARDMHALATRMINGRVEAFTATVSNELNAVPQHTPAVRRMLSRCRHAILLQPDDLLTRNLPGRRNKAS